LATLVGADGRLLAGRLKARRRYAAGLFRVALASSAPLPGQLFEALTNSIRVAGMEAEVVGRASVGDAGAFEELLRRQARPMLQFADFVLHDRSAAEDAVQEAFVIAWKRRKTLKTEAAFVPWLRRIVLRECLRWRRRWFRPVMVIAVNETPAVPDPVVHIDVARAVRRLPARLRAVIFLHFYEDATLATLARDLAIPESTAKSRLYEALRRLARLLPGYTDAASAEEAQ